MRGATHREAQGVPHADQFLLAGRRLACTHPPLVIPFPILALHLPRRWFSPPAGLHAQQGHQAAGGGGDPHAGRARGGETRVRAMCWGDAFAARACAAAAALSIGCNAGGERGADGSLLWAAPCDTCLQQSAASEGGGASCLGPKCSAHAALRATSERAQSRAAGRRCPASITTRPPAWHPPATGAGDSGRRGRREHDHPHHARQHDQEGCGSKV